MLHYLVGGVLRVSFPHVLRATERAIARVPIADGQHAFHRQLDLLPSVVGGAGGIAEAGVGHRPCRGR